MVREVLIPERKIAHRVKELAQEFKSSAQHLDQTVAVIVLEGASRFGTDFLRELYALGIDLPQVSVKISSYGENQESSRSPVIKSVFTPGEFANKHALLIEDILETGHTVETALKILKDEAGFASVTVMYLLAKKDAQEVDVPTDFVGFWIGRHDWVDGYGIDTAEKGRGCKDIMVVKK